MKTNHDLLPYLTLGLFICSCSPHSSDKERLTPDVPRSNECVAADRAAHGTALLDVDDTLGTISVRAGLSAFDGLLTTAAGGPLSPATFSNVAPAISLRVLSDFLKRNYYMSAADYHLFTQAVNHVLALSTADADMRTRAWTYYRVTQAAVRQSYDEGVAWADRFLGELLHRRTSDQALAYCQAFCSLVLRELQDHEAVLLRKGTPVTQPKSVEWLRIIADNYSEGIRFEDEFVNAYIMTIYELPEAEVVADSLIERMSKCHATLNGDERKYLRYLRALRAHYGKGLRGVALTDVMKQ